MGLERSRQGREKRNSLQISERIEVQASVWRSDLLLVKTGREGDEYLASQPARLSLVTKQDMPLVRDFILS
jgi:hypothetical protein